MASSSSGSALGGSIARLLGARLGLGLGSGDGGLCDETVWVSSPGGRSSCLQEAEPEALETVDVL